MSENAVLGIDKAAEVRKMAARLEADKPEQIRKAKAAAAQHKYERVETLWVRATREGDRVVGEIVSGLPFAMQMGRPIKFWAHSVEALEAEARFSFRNALIGYRLETDVKAAQERVAKCRVQFAEVV